jgi:ribulose-5-phosphate 4-epimerase/fuculose-1-phosphate aldolase
MARDTPRSLAIAMARTAEAICAIVDELYRAGLITPIGGNVSARIPGSDNVCITPAGQFKGALRPNDLVVVNRDGGVEMGGRPSSEVDMHLALLNSRPDVGAVIHCHAPYATALGFFDQPIEPLTLIHAYFDDLPRLGFRFSQNPEFAREVVQAIGSHDALLLENHGVVTVGRDLRTAATMAFVVEEIALQSYLARALPGTPRLLPAEALERVRQQRALGGRLFG